LLWIQKPNSQLILFAKVAEGKIDIVNAAKLLNKSRRTTERYLQRYHDVGIQFVIHQNTRKSAYNKACDTTKRKVQALIKKNTLI
jgi:membrane-bound lytic murein transglycosylase MltF